MDPLKNKNIKTLICMLMTMLFFSACGSGETTSEVLPQTSHTDLIPDQEYSVSEKAGHLKEAVSNTQALYDRLMETAASSDNRKANKKATKIETQYKERLKELSEMDLQALSEEEIAELMTEVSDITAAIREVMDLY